jgi:hypothetical protein
MPRRVASGSTPPAKARAPKRVPPGKSAWRTPTPTNWLRKLKTSGAFLFSGFRSSARARRRTNNEPGPANHANRRKWPRPRRRTGAAEPGSTKSFATEHTELRHRGHRGSQGVWLRELGVGAHRQAQDLELVETAPCARWLRLGDRFGDANDTDAGGACRPGESDSALSASSVLKTLSISPAAERRKCGGNL